MAGLPNNLARYYYHSSAPTAEEKTDTKRGDRTSSSYPILNHDLSSNFSDSKDLSFLSMSLQNRLYGLPNSPEALLFLVEISSLGCQCILGGGVTLQFEFQALAVIEICCILIFKNWKELFNSFIVHCFSRKHFSWNSIFSSTLTLPICVSPT